MNTKISMVVLVHTRWHTEWQKAVNLPVELRAGSVCCQLEMVIIAAEAEITAAAVAMYHSEANGVSRRDIQTQ